ncbi:MAG: Gfo/Idh/MocA family oxidoreductase [Lachnospiraceae bacterium]|jgi:predicted dehydrogenase|nr:Gfo/Idh/MocA family oxidoreductase [Lachnospiraceae bacterium]
MDKMRIGVVGCGVISEIYLKNLTTLFPHVEVVGCADTFNEKASQRAGEFRIRPMGTDELVRCPDVDVVLNLTNPRFHADVSITALENGKHVYSEKPLADSFARGRDIMELAAKKNLRVGCAPDTFLGESLQSACKALADGRIGRPLAAAAFMTTPGHERWHTNPAFYYQQGGGPHLDMGPYYLTALVAMLGPISRVACLAGRGHKERAIATGPLAGTHFPVEVDSHYGATMEFACGAILTLMWSFDIWATNLPFIEVYGSEGTLSLPDPNWFDGEVRVRGMADGDFAVLPVGPVWAHPEQNRLGPARVADIGKSDTVKADTGQMDIGKSDTVKADTASTPERHNLRGLGLAQMCQAIQTGGEHCATGEMGLHVLEALEAMDVSAATGQAVPLSTTCRKPPMPVVDMVRGKHGP